MVSPAGISLAAIGFALILIVSSLGAVHELGRTSLVDLMDGDLLPVSAFKDYVDGQWELGASAYEKRGVAVMIQKAFAISSSKDEKVPVMAIGLVCCTVVAIVIGKAVHFSCQFSIGLAVTAFFGFPGTYLISNEVARASGDTPEECAAVMLTAVDLNIIDLHRYSSM